VALIHYQRIELAQTEGDRLFAPRITLDENRPPFGLAMWWRPQAELWLLDVTRADGSPVVLGAVLRDRTDALLGVSTPGRPLGAVVPYAQRPGPLTLDGFTRGSSSLLYLPDGFDPVLFAAYPVAVV
jgi:hypothetical protein